MNKKVKERIENWLATSRELLIKVVRLKKNTDSAFREGAVTSRLRIISEEIENSLGDIKQLLKRLYIILYEVQELLKTDTQESEQPVARAESGSDNQGGKS
jgi:hypothetical protein